MTSASEHPPVRVALDLLGGDHAPEAVLDGALLACGRRPDLAITLVGPPEQAAAMLDARGRSGALTVAAAHEVVGMAEDPARGVRRKRDATVRVAARLVRDGAADAMVSVGSTGAAMAAAVFTLGRLPGLTRPPLAAVVPAAAGPLVLLDVGSTVDSTADGLAQFALAGAAYAEVRLGLQRPRVGLLSNGGEPGKGDALRRAAHDLIAALPVDFVGNVEGHDVARGGVADVVVTDGFTGNVVIKVLEAATAPGAARTGAGAVLLGVDGVVVVGHGAADAAEVASCIEVAEQAVTERLVARTAGALAALVARRRETAGLPVAVARA